LGNRRVPFYPIAGYSAPMAARMLPGAAALAIALAAPAAAGAAPVMVPLKPCYVTAATSAGPQSEGMAILASGFTPNANVELTIDGVTYDGGSALQANADGALPLGPIPAPFVAKGTRKFTLTLTEIENPANTVSTTAKSTALGVKLKPKEARPSRRIRFKGSGFTERKPIWAHYVYKGELRKTVRMARRPRGDCGGFKARRRQIPVKRPGLGNWTIQFDQSRRFKDPEVEPLVFVRLAIRVRLVRG
jgi:hypothetical protein